MEKYGNRATKKKPKQQETWVSLPEALSNFKIFCSISFPLSLLVYCLSEVQEHSFLGSKCWHDDNKPPFILNF